MNQLTESDLKKLTKKQKDVYEILKDKNLDFQLFKEENKFQLMGISNTILIYVFRSGDIKLTPMGKDDHDIPFEDRDTIKDFF